MESVQPGNARKPIDLPQPDLTRGPHTVPAMNPSRRLLLPLLLLAACQSNQHGGSQFVAPQPSPQDPLETISRYEDARTDGDGLLQSLLHTGNARTRERAATALGRLDPSDFGADVTDGLAIALTDESGEVRAAAAFALGQRADPASAGPLLARWRDSDPTVRARLVEAGSRIDDARLRAAVLAALDDPDPRVRSEAVLGIARFPATRKDLLDAESVLVEFLERSPSVSKPAPEADNYWRAFFTFSRNKAARTGSVLDGVRRLSVAALSSSDVRARILAAKALAETPLTDATLAALAAAIRDPDWRVACEAVVALGKQPLPSSLTALTSAAGHTSPHVRRAAMSSLGAFFEQPRFADQRSPIAALLERGREDPSPEVRTAALESEASVLGAASLEHIRTNAKSRDPLPRAAAASAAAKLDAGLAVPLLLDLTHDSSLRVAGIAIEGLSKHRAPGAHARLMEIVTTSEDNGLRLAAVASLREIRPLQHDDVAALLAVMQSSSGEIAPELRAEIAKCMAGETTVLRSLLADADPFVRKIAHDLLVEAGEAVTPPPALRNQTRPASSATVASAPPDNSPNPRVEVKTNRGTMTFELFPAEAPNHVRNLLELAARHHYDGLTFHRVELDFVIQGGDHRGDGNGGITWNGAPLRAEFTPRKYVRGSLGMPRNDDPDSAGSQFFVTHRDTPHLDGRYTNFGQLVSGFDTLDAIEVGDTIESVRVVPVQ